MKTRVSYELLKSRHRAIHNYTPPPKKKISWLVFFYLLEECLQRHVIAFGERECDARILRNPGFFHWRSGGEKHVNDPESIALLQEATKHENKSAYEKYCAAAMASIRYLREGHSLLWIKYK